MRFLSIFSKMTSGLFIFFIISLFFLPAVCETAQLNPTKEKPLKLKYASYTTTATALGAGDEWWCNEVEKRSGGRIKIERYWAESLVKVRESIDAVATGITDITLIIVPYFQGKLALTTATENIYVTENAGAAAMACFELYKSYIPLRSEWEKQKLHLTHFHCGNPAQLVTRKKISKLEDAKGIRIRGFGMVSDALTLLGMTPVNLPAPEVYMGLERGAIEGASGLQMDWVMSMRLYEVAPYITSPGMGIYASQATVINKSLWEKLPNDLQAIVNQLGEEFPYKSTELIMEINSKWIKEGLKNGAKVYALPEEELKRWKSIVTPRIWEDWLKARENLNLPLREARDKFRVLLNKYEPQSKYVPPFEEALRIQKEMNK